MQAHNARLVEWECDQVSPNSYVFQFLKWKCPENDWLYAASDAALIHSLLYEMFSASVVSPQSLFISPIRYCVSFLILFTLFSIVFNDAAIIVRKINFHKRNHLANGFESYSTFSLFNARSTVCCTIQHRWNSIKWKFDYCYLASPFGTPLFGLQEETVKRKRNPKCFAQQYRVGDEQLNEEKMQTLPRRKIKECPLLLQSSHKKVWLKHFSLISITEYHYGEFISPYFDTHGSQMVKSLSEWPKRIGYPAFVRNIV